MLLIGLTGGIGSGKSYVCEIFRALGVPVIDSDVIARELVEPESKVLKQIASLFGDQVIQQNGSLNRALMRELVFNDENKRKQLEALLHPLIREEMQRQIDTLRSAYVVLAIPLLLERGWQQLLDRVLVIDCAETQQLQRAVSRDGSSQETIKNIMDSQIRREERLATADDIIDNSGSIESLHSQVEALHHHYLKLASNN